jgi:hypothetical protein
MATNVLPLLLIGMAETPPIEIPVGLLRLVPVIVTSVPTGPVVAEKEIIVGAGIKVKPASEALPPGVVRLTAPVDPVPTIATIEVDDTTVNDVTGVPPNVMVDVLLKFVPVILINVPAAAVVGANAVIVGAAIKVKPANEVVPPGVVRLTAPVDPVPTIAAIEVDDTTVNEVTGVPPNVITEVPVKFVPVILINVPAAAVVGANEVMVGAGGKYLYTQAAPTKLLSKKPPTIAVLPSALRETPRP